MRDHLLSADRVPRSSLRRQQLVPGSVVLIDLRYQQLIGLLESLSDRQFSSNHRRHKLTYRLSDRFKLWNTHILNTMIGDRIERRLIRSRGINGVKRNLSERSSLLIVGVLVNRSTCTRGYVGPAEGLAR